MSDSAVHGPIDFVLIEFPGDRLGGKAADALLDAVERGVVALYDLLVIRKDADGAVTAVAVDDLDREGLEFSDFAGARSGLLGDEDLRDAASAMAPGTIAALVVYENTWAIPFVAAARDAGGDVVASARIPAADVLAALDALDAVGPAEPVS